MSDPLARHAAAFGALRTAALREQRAEARAAYEVGYEKGWMHGYETAERASGLPEEDR